MNLRSPPMTYKRCPNWSVGIKQKLKLRSDQPSSKACMPTLIWACIVHHPEGPIGSVMSEKIKGFVECLDLSSPILQLNVSE